VSLRRFFILLLLASLAGCATPVLQPRGEHPTKPRLEAERVIAADGATLPLSSWRPQGTPRAVVLALHGFNDYRNAFAEVGPFLAARDIATYAYDLRGFGATTQPGIWPGSDLLAEDVRTVAALLREAHPGRPLYLLGESMGGALAMSVLAETPGAADGTLLVAAAVWGRETMNPLQRGALWLLAHSFPGMQLSGRGLKITASDNKAMLRALHDDPLALKEARTDALWGLTNLMDRALAAAPALTMPVLVLYGERDEIIRPRPPAACSPPCPPRPASRSIPTATTCSPATSAQGWCWRTWPPGWPTRRRRCLPGMRRKRCRHSATRIEHGLAHRVTKAGETNL